MTGRALMWVGWVTVAGSVVGLGAYFVVAGFHRVDAVGVIGAVVGMVGLVLAAYGLVLARRDTTTGSGAGPAGGVGAGGVHNEFSGGTVHGPMVMGRNISGSIYGSTPPSAAPPATGEGAGGRPDRPSGGTAGESQR